MPTRIAISSSQTADVFEAAQQAAIQAREQLNGAEIDLVIVFATPFYARSEILEIIYGVLRPRRLIGTSTTGIILSEHIASRGIGILAISSDEMGFGITGVRPIAGADMRTAGFDCARRMTGDLDKTPHRGCLLFTDYRLHNSGDFIRGIQDVIGFGTPIVGAISGAAVHTPKNCQFYQKQVLNQSAVGVLISGAHFVWGNKHGYKPLGKPRFITKSEDNIIQAIDGLPPVHIYEEFLNLRVGAAVNKETFSSFSSLYPLGIYSEEEGQFLLKNAVDILEDGSIVCQGMIPQDAEVHLMIGNRDSCKQSAIEAAGQVRDALGGRQARLIIIIESIARQKILKKNSFLEIQVIKEVLGYTTPIIGMYGLGEMLPSQQEDIPSPRLRNESILIVAVE